MNIFSIISIAFFVLCNLVGSGFLLIPKNLSILGLSCIFSWLICLSIALIYSIIFGVLFEKFPNSQTITDYFNFNESLKKLITYMYLLSCVIGNTGIVIMILSILQINNLFAVFALIFLTTVLNDYVDYNYITKIEFLISFLKFFVLLGLPIILFLTNTNVLFMPVVNCDYNLITSLGIYSFWCFLGIESVLVVAKGKEAKYGLILGVLLSGFLYIMVSLFVISSIPMEMLKNSNMPFLTLLSVYNLQKYEWFVKILILFVVLSSLYTWVGTIGKFILSYAQSSLLPEIFLIETSSKNSKYGLYLSSLIMFLIIVAINFFQVLEQFDFIAMLCCKITLLLYACCSCLLLFYENHLKVLGFLGILVSLISLCY